MSRTAWRRSAAERAAATGRPVRVLIVGGGCAGMATAWELAKLPGYEIDVVERSLRLGGKGASTRDSHGRVLEHGLHVWLGFYENAFALMRECYAVVEQCGWGPEAARGARLAHGRFDDAFVPEPHVGVAGLQRHEWDVWSGHLPPMPGEPGTPLDQSSNPFSLTHYLTHALVLVRALVHSLVGGPQAGLGRDPDRNHRAAADEAMDLDFEVDFGRSPRAAIESLTDRLRSGTYVSAAVLLQAIALFEDWLRSVNFAPQVADSAQALVEAITVQLRRQLGHQLSIDPQARWKTTVIDIVMTIFVGLYRDRVFWHPNGLDCLNRFDYRTWLRRHGASFDALESPFLRGIYDLVFAYRDGRRDQPSLAAGVALRGALRMFLGYREAMFWRMRSGMGDAVFAPLYRALLQAPRAEGALLQSAVRFHFGCALQRLDFGGPNPADGLERLQAAVFERRATLGPDDALDHFGGWPVDPPAQSLAQPEQVVWRADRDFDVVVLACGPAAIEAACTAGGGAVLQRLEAWREALAHADTIATRSLQLWLDRGLADLGWLRGPIVLSGLGAPLDTWADMTHVLATEQAWRDRLADDDGGAPRTSAARSLAYLCGVHTGADDPGLGREVSDLLTGQRTQAGAPAWTRSLWPRAFSGDGDLAARCVDGVGAALGADALIEQHWQVNEEGSERYALSLPGSVESRISPLDCDVSNVVLCGDWTACGLDAGCVEAAVMSGRLAAHAVTGGTPALKAIVGWDHP